MPHRGCVASSTASVARLWSFTVQNVRVHTHVVEKLATLHVLLRLDSGRIVGASILESLKQFLVFEGNAVLLLSHLALIETTDPMLS